MGEDATQRPFTSMWISSSNREGRTKDEKQHKETLNKEDEIPFASNSDTYDKSRYTTASLPDVKDRRFVHVYDMPKLNPASVPFNQSQSFAKPQQYHVSTDSVEFSRAVNGKWLTLI